VIFSLNLSTFLRALAVNIVLEVLGGLGVLAVKLEFHDEWT
jgi:hypothetical protein